jgi:Glycosyltransferase 36 associated family.
VKDAIIMRFTMSIAALSGYETDMDTFLGKNNGYEHPVAVFNGKCSNSHASGWMPIGCHEDGHYLTASRVKGIYIYTWLC